jgi:hypothetical protein
MFYVYTLVNVKHHFMKIFASALLLMLCFSLGSCTKEVTNVVNQAFSINFPIPANAWVRTTDGKGYTTSLNVPEITPNITDNGGVIVYLSFDGGDTYEALPEVFNGVSYGTYHGDGFVNIDLYSTTGGTLASPPGGSIQAKILIVDAQPE